jgi:ribulose-5-phosphate 4-epimerase/fuculose-1-phosphate aldolase
VQEDDLYKINIKGDVVEVPKNPKLKPSECTPLFNAVYRLRKAGACIHSHSIHVMLVTKIFESEV